MEKDLFGRNRRGQVIAHPFPGFPDKAAASVLAVRSERPLDETGKKFVCAEHSGRLATLGWTDMWRHHNSGMTEYTWYSKLKGGARGNGFRLDHAFATPSLKPHVISCRYSHREREAGISDYSIVIVEIAPPWR